LPIAENARGVMSKMRLVRHWPLQHVASPQKLRVRGPQSRIVTQTVAPHWCRTFITAPHPRRGMLPSPHASGRVMSQQLWYGLGQAACMLSERQPPQAPPPAPPQGPQPGPQQNQVVSPLHKYV
jgi:hypothetical protein